MSKIIIVMMFMSCFKVLYSSSTSSLGFETTPSGLPATKACLAYSLLTISDDQSFGLRHKLPKPKMDHCPLGVSIASGEKYKNPGYKFHLHEENRQLTPFISEMIIQDFHSKIVSLPAKLNGKMTPFIAVFSDVFRVDLKAKIYAEMCSTTATSKYYVLYALKQDVLEIPDPADFVAFVAGVRKNSFTTALNLHLFKLPDETFLSLKANPTFSNKNLPLNFLNYPFRSDFIFKELVGVLREENNWYLKEADYRGDDLKITFSQPGETLDSYPAAPNITLHLVPKIEEPKPSIVVDGNGSDSDFEPGAIFAFEFDSD